jgi:hypothetical protein
MTNIVEQVRLLREWSPLIGYGRRLAATLDARERAVIIGDLLEWLAEKTQTRFDDRLATRVAAILKTPEGTDLVRELLAIADALNDNAQETDS